MQLEDRLRKYAELIIKRGCALKPGQDLFVTAPLQVADFARMVAKRAYEEGARYVTVKWHDDVTARYAYDYAGQDVFETMPSWQVELNNSMARNGAAVLTILSDNPELMCGVDQRKVKARVVASHRACGEFYDALDKGRVQWCIVGAASEQWASKVYPKLSPDIAVKRLWQAILDTSRVDCDPCAAWDRHRASFDARKRWLNAQHFDRLVYHAGNGTDLTVGLPRRSHWEGGGQEGADGTYFFPNIPTEEIFTSPDRLRVDGVVHSSLPLIYNGAPVKNFWVRFECGRAVECDAEVGKDILQGIIDTDETSCYLGECSLVPFDSPIRNTGILFYETLYDENASCHLAFGKGFPETLPGGYDMSDEELMARGVNVSATHVDFMVGTEDMDITGVTSGGVEVPVFRHGNWAVPESEL